MPISGGEATQLRAEGGSLHIPHAIYDEYLSGSDAAILLIRDGTTLLMPVQSAAGGILLKVRNRAGDRVMHLGEFMSANGIDTTRPSSVTASWNSEYSGLALSFEDR